MHIEGAGATDGSDSGGLASGPSTAGTTQLAATASERESTPLARAGHLMAKG